MPSLSIILRKRGFDGTPIYFATAKNHILLLYSKITKLIDTPTAHVLKYRRLWQRQRAPKAQKAKGKLIAS